MGPPRRDLQQRPKVKRKFRHLKGARKLQGGREERCENCPVDFFNGEIEGRGIDVNIRFLGIKGFWGEDFCWDWFPQMHFKIKLWICFVGRGSGVGFAWCWFDLFSIISSYKLKTHDERTSLFGGRGMFSNWFPEMHLYESLFFWTGDNFNSVGQNSKWQPKSQVFRTKNPGFTKGVGILSWSWSISVQHFYPIT